MEREREREGEYHWSYEAVSLLGLFCCGLAATTMCLAFYICKLFRSTLAREYTRVCGLFLKAGLFEMNLTCGAKIGI